MEENKKLYYSIGEVSKMLNLNPSLLRYWEKEFPTLIKPRKNKKGDRFYAEKDIENIKLIYVMTKEQGMKLRAVKKKLLEKQKLGEKDAKIEAIKILTKIKEMLEEIKNSL